MAAGYGLSKEEALKLITSNNAKILGIDNVTGTIKAGKDANIIISKGDILDMKSSVIEYAFITRECAKALEIVNNENGNFNFLTEINLENLIKFKEKMPEKIYNRALFVVEENERTLIAKEKLKNSDLRNFADLMYLSHFGLKNLYDVSCQELDFLVDQTVDNSKILGARMMGGGFGGCTINIIHSEEVESFVRNISKKYLDKFSKNLTPIITTLGKGLNYKIIR